MRNQAEIDSILNDVRARLNDRKLKTGVDLLVQKDGYLIDDDWLNIIVSPATAGIHAYQYVEALSEVEGELRQHGIEKVLLVPAAAG